MNNVIIQLEDAVEVAWRMMNDYCPMDESMKEVLHNEMEQKSMSMGTEYALGYKVAQQDMMKSMMDMFIEKG